MVKFRVGQLVRVTARDNDGVWSSSSGLFKSRFGKTLKITSINFDSGKISAPIQTGTDINGNAIVWFEHELEIVNLINELKES